MDSVTHLLDTHAVIWAYEDSGNLGPEARAVIQQAPPRTLGVSDFSLFELALLVHKGRVRLDFALLEFLERVEKNYVVFPIGAAEVVAAMELPLAQADPFDRAIVATAHCRKLPLLTKDRKITASGLVSVVW